MIPAELKVIIDREAEALQKKSIVLDVGRNKAYGFKLGAAFMYKLFDELVTEHEQELKDGEEKKEEPVLVDL